MSRAVEECGLGGVQLHGGEPAEFAAEVKRRLQVTVIRAFRLDEPLAELEKSPADFLLLDHYARGQFGGTGQTVDWDAAARLARDGLAARLILSGGLSAENVRDACRAVRPFGVDASSRLESAPGVKDHARIRDFIAHAKEQIPSR